MEQKTKSKSRGKFSKSSFLVVIFLFALCLLAGFFNVFQKFEYKMYDSMLKVHKDIPQDESVCIIDIDDESISYLGSWPWKRDILTEVLYRLKELGAATAVFDIEYLDESTLAVDDNLKDTVSSEFEKIFLNLENDLPKDELGQVIYDSQQSITDGFSLNYDDEFGKAIEFFDNAFLTVNLRDIGVDRSPEDLEYVKNRFLFRNVTDPLNKINAGNQAVWQDEEDTHNRGFVPALNRILSHARGLGFTNVVVDKDGVRRRVELLNYYDGKYVLQLAFSPLVHNLGVTDIERKNHSVVLKNAKLPGSDKVQDIEIPVDSQGCMLINWTHSLYLDSFTHIPVYYLYDLYNGEKRLVSDFDLILNSDHIDYESLSEKENALFERFYMLSDRYSGISDLKNSIKLKCSGFDAAGQSVRRGRRGGGLSQNDYDQYFGDRKDFFDDSLELAEEILADEDLCRFVEVTDFASHIKSYCSTSQALGEVLNGKFCLIGNSASASTDLGVTPFEKRYANLGTHANVINTIIQGQFITEVHWIWGLAAAAALVLIVIISTSSLSPASKNILGLIYLFIIPALCSALMIFKSIYVPIIIPLIFVIAVYLSQMIINFLAVEGDKNFIKGAFSQCLSADVVNDIIKDPSSLKLGGFTYDMTAIFTDIQKFSGFSEFLTPQELVAFLNYYLTDMSDIIISERGTVDKYEGDAIVAFVGAPVQMADHAVRACTAAIKMKQAENRMNEEIRQYASGEKIGDIDPDLLSAFRKMVSNGRSLFTRIGINSGDMVAGFMGSQNKKNYTMMGNNVNLASRLEGVNKQYSTNGILISGTTESMLDDTFIVRRLDRVRVVNVKTPLRLYELISFKADADQELLDYIKNWETAMDTFESRDYDKALKMFRFLSKKRPDDKVAKYYSVMLTTFFTKGKYPAKDDDFGVEYNPDDGVFTLLQK
ncbi:adenylate/guanylate cyclase domain-containing protein [Treponema sp.]|uniref:adenylate/guanylate cyclase domain-containing protein n=1 Tax=Treponema sp. TaxID=166 RepID=UPI0025DCF9D6|nr:adenylate/guanylate cyclase domain-containing protein [Treponema sp.]MCR5217934.1 adenylate/guanylate cyclase domain-containing protein [Treponema sp.]